MYLNYEDIGNRIRYKRKKKHLTQETLAELCNISIPHMSNIENGNTKVSLPVLVNIANYLNCTLDEILFGNIVNNCVASDAIINDILHDCTNKQKSIIIDTIISLKESLSKHGEK